MISQTQFFKNQVQINRGRVCFAFFGFGILIFLLCMWRLRWSVDDTNVKWSGVIRRRLHMKSPLRTKGNYLLWIILGLVHLAKLRYSSFSWLECPTNEAASCWLKRIMWNEVWWIRLTQVDIVGTALPNLSTSDWYAGSLTEPPHV